MEQFPYLIKKIEAQNGLNQILLFEILLCRECTSDAFSGNLTVYWQGLRVSAANFDLYFEIYGIGDVFVA